MGNERNGGTKMGWRWRGNVETQTRGTVTDSSRSFANRYTIFLRDLPAIREAAFDSSYRKKRDEGKRDEKAKRQLDRDAFYSRSIESMPIVTRAIVSISAKYRVSSPYSDSNWTREGCGAWQRPSPSIGEIIDRRKYRASLKSGRD